MKRLTSQVIAVFLALSACADAATFRFDTDPFEGSDALTTPGRQIVAGEKSIDFSIAKDLFAFEPAVFGVGNQILFANDIVGNLPDSYVNVIVLQTTDNDSNPATPFGAGNAASLIADQITQPGPGFFVYFNSGLDLPRLVFSTDLNDNTADLKVLARMTNLAGQAGSLRLFSNANFATIPEPSSFLLAAAAGTIGVLGRGMRRWRPQTA